MKATVVALALALAASTSTVSAQPVRWTRYTIPQTGTSVDFPSSIFTEEAGRPDGYGQRFRTADGRADLTIQATPNLANDSPAAFLAKKHPPSRIQYKRVTPSFFAVSSYKGRQSLVRPLQLLRAAGPLRADQLSRRRRARLGRRRHPHEPIPQRQVGRRWGPRMTSSAGAR